MVHQNFIIPHSLYLSLWNSLQSSIGFTHTVNLEKSSEDTGKIFLDFDRCTS